MNEADMWLNILDNLENSDNKDIYLTILTGKNSALLNSVQEFIEIEAWLLLNFFICLHNPLSSIHSIASS